MIYSMKHGITQHADGECVAQDTDEAIRLYTLAAAQGLLRLAAAQGDAHAQSLLDDLATLPISQPGMLVQVFGVTSAGGMAINGRQGLAQDTATKPGRAAVLLDGDVDANQHQHHEPSQGWRPLMHITHTPLQLHHSPAQSHTLCCYPQNTLSCRTTARVCNLSSDLHC